MKRWRERERKGSMTPYEQSTVKEASMASALAISTGRKKIKKAITFTSILHAMSVYGLMPRLKTQKSLPIGTSVLSLSLSSPFLVSFFLFSLSPFSPHLFSAFFKLSEFQYAPCTSRKLQDIRNWIRE